MKNKNTIVTIALSCSVASAWFGSDIRPSKALPIYSRRYGVDCNTCHSVAPRLNAFGLAFQANHFNWPVGKPPEQRLGVDAFPVSGLATYSSVRNNTANFTKSEFNSLELFASNGFSIDKGKQGGYFVDYFTGTGDAEWGVLGDAFVTAPLAGRLGEFAVTVGQFTPLTYQYDSLNSLPRSIPAALSTGADSFALTLPTPGVRLEYFDNRKQGTANGTYVNAGIPYSGFLAFNNQSQVDGPHGFYADVFRRQDTFSYGAYGYWHDANRIDTLLATFDPCPCLGFLAAASEGQDQFGSSHEYSVQADYMPREDIGVTARIDSTTSKFVPSTTYPVLAFTYYPGRQHVIRLLGQTIQNPHNRTSALFVFGQF
jgi:hypothetical protein